MQDTLHVVDGAKVRIFQPMPGERTMQDTLHVVDGGMLDGPSNLACDRRMLRIAGVGEFRHLLRFHRYTPAVTVGRQQALAREARIDYCRERGIDIVRRPSGGGALYRDANQLAFTLAASGARSLRFVPFDHLLLKLAWIVARALRSLGFPAQAAAPNDVEVGHRKIGSVYLSRHGDTVLVHGCVLLDADMRTMLAALRVPTEKLTADGLATARTRLVTVAELGRNRTPPEAVEAALAWSFARALNARAAAGEIEELSGPASPAEREAERAFADSLIWDSADDAIESVLKTAGNATLRARARFSPGGESLHEIEFATDAHFEPVMFLCELADALRAMPVASLEDAVTGMMRTSAVDTCGFSATDVTSLVRQLAGKQRLASRGALSRRDVNALMLHDASGSYDIQAILDRATVMLVPYCAKPAWCKWRHRDGCTECGLCEVGNAYRLARERGARVVTIVNYEHLVDTLREMKQNDVPAYVGMCCSNFFVKRHRAFVEAGMPSVLMDIAGANCYELNQENEAYAGTFRAEAKLDGRLLARVVALMPPPRSSTKRTDATERREHA
jgi:lipoate-protein ligase A